MESFDNRFTSQVDFKCIYTLYMLGVWIFNPYFNLIDGIGSRTRLKCGISWVQAPIGSNQRL